MSVYLVRCWLPPRHVRRWPRAVRWAGCGALAGGSFALALVPLRAWRHDHTWEGFGALLVEPILSLFLIAVSVGLGFAGAMTIAPERERGTWEPLVATPMGVRAIVRAKLIVQATRGAAWVALSLPFWLGWGYEVLEVNGVGPMRADDGVPHRALVVRTLLYLTWLGVRMAGHALPFVAIGLAVSTRCRRSRTALAWVCAVAAAYGLGVWASASVVPYWEQTLLFRWSARDVWRSPAAAIVRWPYAPGDWTSFSSGHLLPDYWFLDAAADAIWLVLVPWCCYRLALRWCRRYGM